MGRRFEPVGAHQLCHCERKSKQISITQSTDSKIGGLSNKLLEIFKNCESNAGIVRNICRSDTIKCENSNEQESKRSDEESAV